MRAHLPSSVSTSVHILNKTLHPSRRSCDFVNWRRINWIEQFREKRSTFAVFVSERKRPYMFFTTKENTLPNKQCPFGPCQLLKLKHLGIFFWLIIIFFWLNGCIKSDSLPWFSALIKECIANPIACLFRSIDCVAFFFCCLTFPTIDNSRLSQSHF